MKDYLNYKEKGEKPTYIKNFKMNGDKIKVMFANGDKNIVPNTKENKEKIEQKLQNQVAIGEKNYGNKVLSSLFLGSVFIIILSSTTAFVVEQILKDNLSNLVNLIGVTGSTGLSAFVGLKAKKNLGLALDIRKSKEFIENKELLKEITIKNKGYLLDGVSSKAMKTFKNDGPSINDVEKKFKLNDFEIILNNKKIEEEIGLDYNVKTLKK